MALTSYFILRNGKCTSSLAKKSSKCQKHPVDRLAQLFVHHTKILLSFCFYSGSPSGGISFLLTYSMHA